MLPNYNIADLGVILLTAFVAGFAISFVTVMFAHMKAPGKTIEVMVWIRNNLTFVFGLMILSSLLIFLAVILTKGKVW